MEGGREGGTQAGRGMARGERGAAEMRATGGCQKGGVGVTFPTEIINGISFGSCCSASLPPSTSHEHGIIGSGQPGSLFSPLASPGFFPLQ